MNNQNNFFNKPYVAAAFVLGLAFVVAFVIGGSAVKSLRAGEQSINVTGSAKERVESDVAKIGGSFERKVAREALATGYKQINADKDTSVKILKDLGVKDEELTVNPVSSYETFDYDQNGNRVQGSGMMVLSQSFSVSSSDIAKVKTISEKANLFADKGIFVQMQSPQFLYSQEKLAGLRVSLLGKAIEDAKARADVIAKGSGTSVTKLVGASSGVVQLLSPDSVNVEDYGSYDTSTVSKDVMVTVKAQFRLR